MLKSIPKQSLNQQIWRSLREYIRKNDLKPGDKLPPEREIASQLGVSRTTLRESLSALEVIGVISRRPRQASILGHMDIGVLADLSQFLLIQTPSDLKSLLFARRLIEFNILPEVVNNATEEDFENMETANSIMEAEITAGRIGTEADIEFHQALIAAAKNPIVSQLGDLIHEFFRILRTKLLVDEKQARQGLQVHKEILQALKDKDVDRASQFMKIHLDNYHERGIVEL